jgi:hypothetical protein
VKRDAPELETSEEAVKRRIRDAGARARAEAEARRKAAADAARAGSAPVSKEVDGREGPDPVRHGDWEVKGIASDF